MRNILLCSLLIAFSLCIADTLEVDINGLHEYISIQTAVNDAVNGDVVLVHPGTYYENIVIIDKFITLASLNYTTGDEQYIHSTVLDGNFNGSVIRMELYAVPQPADVIIQGFSIVHGSGYVYNNLEPEKGGGGLYIVCDDSDYYHDVQLNNCQIKYNTADYGAGIDVAYWLNLHMRNVSVHNNISKYGPGGINVVYSGIINYPEYPCSYYMNEGSQGHDVFFSAAKQDIELFADTVSVSEPDLNGYIEYHLDDESDPHELSLSYQHHVFELIDHDLYVSPEGDDGNSGLSLTEPLKTIRRAAMLIKSNPEQPRTIYLAPGEYSDIDGEQQFGIGLKPHVSLIGAGVETTLLHINDSKQLLIMWHSFDHTISDLSMKSTYPVSHGGYNWSPSLVQFYYVDDLRFENIRAYDSDLGHLPAIHTWFSDGLIVKNILIEYMSSISEAGMHLIGDNIEIEDCTIRNNTSSGSSPLYPGRTAFTISTRGNSTINRLVVMNNVNSEGEDKTTGYLLHGVSTPGSQLRITNSLFCDNVSGDEHCFLIKPYAGNIEFTNCTFANNSSSEYMIKYRRTSDQYEVEPIVFTNCVLWDSTAYEMVNASGQRCAIEVQHSLFRNGEGGIYSPYDEVIWGEGNLDTDPLLLGAEDFYYPMEGSPLINAGTPDTTGLCLPPHDLMHRARVWDGCIDIGCHEYGSVGVSPDPEPEEVPATPLALANYPNPFNPWTRISYSLPEAAHVKLSVYNIRGQRVTTLVDESQSIGDHSAVWDGRDERMNIVAGGVYLLRLQAGERTEVTKVLMVK